MKLAKLSLVVKPAATKIGIPDVVAVSVDGAVVAFVDLSEFDDLAEKLREAREQLKRTREKP